MLVAFLDVLVDDGYVVTEAFISATAAPAVVYFDQQTGAPHPVCWLKSIF